MPRSRRPGPRQHPSPPKDLATRSLPIATTRGPWWRIHGAAHSALFFGRTGLYRFDDPARGFGVLYAGDSPECAFIETFGHATGVRVVTMAELRARMLTELRVDRDLRLVDLTGAGLAALGADNRLCNGGGYSTAQA